MSRAGTVPIRKRGEFSTRIQHERELWWPTGARQLFTLVGDAMAVLPGSRPDFTDRCERRDVLELEAYEHLARVRALTSSTTQILGADLGLAIRGFQGRAKLALLVHERLAAATLGCANALARLEAEHEALQRGAVDD